MSSSSGFVETATGNRVSKESFLLGTQNVRIQGKSVIHSGVVIRADLGNVKIGKFCILKPGVVLRPAYRLVKGQLVYYALSLGDNVVIEEDCIIEASAIGSGVRIGKGSIISKRCVIKDCCWIKPGSVLAPDTVVAPFSIFEGCPAHQVGELPECSPEMMRSVALEEYYTGSAERNLSS